MCSSINPPSICCSSWIAFQQRWSLLEGKASRPGPGQKQQLRSIRRVLWQLLMQLHPGGCAQLSRMLMMMASKTSSSSHLSLIHLLCQVLLPPHLLHPLLLNLYVTYARNGMINILLPFMDLLRNVRPYVTCPASFSSHLQLRS